MVIRAKEGKKKLEIEWDKDKKNLFEWYQCINHAEGLKQKTDGGEAAKHNLDEYKVKGKNGKKELSLMSFNFQLNQILMLLNNPMLFPHLDYVEMFNRFNNTQNEEGSAEDV